MTTRRTRLVAAAVLALAALSTALPAQAAAGTTTIRVGALDRGEGPRVPQVLGTTILDGGRKVEVDAREVHLLGASGDDYVAIVYGDSGAGAVERIDADGTRTVLVEGANHGYLVSDDGEQLWETRVRGGGRSVVVVRDTATGEREGRRAFGNVVTVLDASEGRAVLGIEEPARTLWWNSASDATKRITDRYGYAADIAADRFAVLTGDPLAGGCSTVATLSAPRTTLWRSCDHAVLAFSPNGRRLITHTLYLDGPVSQVQVRGDHGKLFRTYRVKGGGLGSWGWEDNRAALLLAQGPEKSAIVRCEAGDCERASRTIASPY